LRHTAFWTSVTFARILVAVIIFVGFLLLLGGHLIVA